MSRVQEQIDARKRRLNQLSRRGKVYEKPTDHENAVDSVPTSDTLSSPQIEPDEITNGKDHQSQETQTSEELHDDLPHDGTENMRCALKGSFDELNRRTDETMKRIVRQRIISDAVNQK